MMKRKQTPKTNIVKKILMVILVLLVTQIIFQIGVYAAYFIRDTYYPGDNSVFQAVFQLLYLILTLLALFVASRFIKSDWGFSPKNFNRVKKSFILLLVVWLWLIVFLFAANYILPDSDYASLKWYQAVMEFVSWTFGAGIIEEILFRALLITLLYRVFIGKLSYTFKYTSNDLVLSKKKKVENPKKYEQVFSISTAAIISAVIFSLQHISYQFYPFEILRLSWSQVGLALFLGLALGMVFEKTKSIYHVILIHCMIDSIAGFSILFSYLFGAK